LFGLYKTLYFGFGSSGGPVAIDHVLRDLKRIAAIPSAPAPADPVPA
jgi:L-ribulokinase